MRRGHEIRHELAGGLGDAGLFVPIAVALVAVNGLSATAVFGVGGLAYLATALYFRVPVPVQPLKAFAAAAIALELEPAGVKVGSAFFGWLAATGMAGWLAARFPLVLVRGIQASVALLLAKASVDLAERGNWQGLPAVAEWVGVAVAAGACALLLVLRASRVPAALVVLAGGLVAGIAVAGGLPAVGYGPEAPALSVPASRS